MKNLVLTPQHSFFEALSNQNIRLIRRQLAKDPELANATNGIAFPLYIAARRKCFGIARELIHHGANVNEGLIAEGYQYSIGDTPLIASIQSGSMRIFDMLLEHGANVDVINNWGYCPLTVALEYYQLKFFKKLLEVGANPNIESRGYCPLHYVAMKSTEPQSLSYAKLLIKYGADINKRSNEVETPVVCADEGTKLYNYLARLIDKNGGERSVNFEKWTERPEITFADLEWLRMAEENEAYSKRHPARSVMNLPSFKKG